MPSVNTKLAVHWAPSVNVMTPGWMVALLAGAQAKAPVAAVAAIATSDTAVSCRKPACCSQVCLPQLSDARRVGPLPDPGGPGLSPGPAGGYSPDP